MAKYIVMDVETTGLCAWYGDMITCICAKTDDGHEFKEAVQEENTEARLIEHFLTWVTLQGNDVFLISKNGKGFDIPFIQTRMVKLHMPYTEKLLNYKHLDLQLMTKKWMSLDDMAKLLNCERKNGNGIDAIFMFRNGEFKELIEYCMQDVNVTEQVYKKLKSLGHSI
jgi:uncharacterized protein YprB with RNaseH-like and TPR domain